MSISTVPDSLPSGRRSLNALVRPRTIAVIGASDRATSVGYTLVRNLQALHKRDTVFLVSAHYATIEGVPTYPSITALPMAVDLAVIATPAPTVPAIIRECITARVAAAIVLANDGWERGAAGATLDPALVAEAQRSGLRLLGPTGFGMMLPHNELNASSATLMAKRGNVAFVSQSDALCTAVLDWSRQEQVGFSAFLSVGSMPDVGWGDLLDVLGDDLHTESIVLYMETVGDARAFLSAAREVTLVKPVIVLKTGPTADAVEATYSHGGTRVGSDAVFDAAFRRCGVLRVCTIADLFGMAAVLAKQPRPYGSRLMIVTNAGGPGVLATDALLRSGGQRAVVSTATRAALAAALPLPSHHGNPLHLGSDADPQRYAAALKVVAASGDHDGVLVILTPHAATDPEATAQALLPFAKMPGKPLLASWMGGSASGTGEALLNHAGIPTFAYPDTAARMFANMWRYSDQLRALYETPLFADDAAPPREQIAASLQAARQAGQTLLDGAVVKPILAAYGLPAVPPDGTGSNDAAGAYEFSLSSSMDDTFGPVLVFGVGGHVADVVADRAFGLPPLTTTLARRMLEQTQIVPALMRMGDPPPVNITALEQTLVRFSRLVIEQPSIKEIYVNPLLATAQGVAVLDAQIVLHAGNVDEHEFPKPAIRPYPAQYIFPWALKDGTPVTIRPIRPEDEPLMVRFHGTLSPHSVQMRYFAPLTLSRRIDHERLVRMCFIDYDREMALVMVRADPQTGDQVLLAVGRLATLPGTNTAEFALLISDQYQGHGIGTELLRRLVDVGRDDRLHQITAQILPENRAMQHVAEKVGFRLRRVFREQVVVAELDL